MIEPYPKDGVWPGNFHHRVGNYLWWIEHVVLPEGEEPCYV